MPRLPPKPKPDYSLRRRFFDQIGRPLPWQDYGKGEFTDIDTVQRQIKNLAGTTRKVEIEFIYKDKLCDIKGNETGETIIYEKR